MTPYRYLVTSASQPNKFYKKSVFQVEGSYEACVPCADRVAGAGDGDLVMSKAFGGTEGRCFFGATCGG